MKVAMVLTSHDRLGATGKPTGFWLEEFIAPYYVFFDAGIDITLASPQGGQPPLDPASNQPDAQTQDTERFRTDRAVQQALAKTIPLARLRAEDFDAVFYPGGHGPLWDLAEDPHSIALIERIFADNKPVGAVCHAPGVLRHVKKPDGTPLVSGKRVTGFSNSEEQAAKLDHIVPFSVEDELKRLGGVYERTDDWQSLSIIDGHLVTGQNPASSVAAAQNVLKLLRC